jgi:hypothetical protein
MRRHIQQYRLHVEIRMVFSKAFLKMCAALAVSSLTALELFNSVAQAAPLVCLDRTYKNAMSNGNTCLCKDCPPDQQLELFDRAVAKDSCAALGCKGTVCVGDGGGRRKRELSEEGCALARAHVEDYLKFNPPPELEPCAEGCTDCGVAVWTSGVGNLFTVSCTVGYERNCVAGPNCPGIPTPTPTNTATPLSKPTNTPAPQPSPYVTVTAAPSALPRR